MRTRIIIVIVALVLGGTAAILAAGYLKGARTEIEAQSEPVKVLVAKEDLPRGLTAEDLVARKLIAEQEVPRRFVPAGAVSSARTLEGMVLAVPLSAGEFVTQGRFQFPSTAGLAYSVPEDFVALSLPVDAVRGVAGLVKPGDHVVVFATVETAKKGQAKQKTTKLLIAKARVLAVGASLGVEATEEDGQAQGVFNGGSGGSSGSGGSEGQVIPSNITLALAADDAEKVVFCEEAGSVWLALLPATSTGGPKTPGQTDLTVFK